MTFFIPGSNGLYALLKISFPPTDKDPWEDPWYAFTQEMISLRLVNLLANLSAPSTASLPELTK